MKSRTVGIVEGFFSTPLSPWTHRERCTTIEFVSREAPGLNCYFYCPKNDRRVTERWASPYEGSGARELQALTKRCRRRGIETIYGLNPLLDDLDPTEPRLRARWLRAVTAKLDHVLSLGFEGICLLFDDIPLAYDVADNAPLVVTPGEQMMIDLVNEIHARFQKRVSRFWFCGPDYCFRRATPLTRGLRFLHPEIGVVWTGNEIFVKNISASDLSRVKRLLGKDREIIYWVNYPVNDCEQGVGTFNLGGIPCPTPDVVDKLGAFLVNPMRECYANLPAYVTLSRLAKDPRGYRRGEAWQQALRTMFEDNAAAAQLIIDNFGTRSIVDDGPPPLLKRLSGEKGLMRVTEAVRHAVGALRGRGVGQDAARFCGAIEQVLRNAEWFVEIAEFILSKRPISLSVLRQNDWFPTNVTQARYAPEIVRILSQRLIALGGRDRRSVLGLRERAEIQAFAKRYAGQQKLGVKPREGMRIVKMVGSLVRSEQRAVCEFLNDASRPPVVRLRGYLARSSVSRFSLP